VESKRWELGAPSGKQGKIPGSLLSESLSLSSYFSKAKHPSWDLHLSPLPVLVPVLQLQPFYICQLDLLPLFGKVYPLNPLTSQESYSNGVPFYTK
jgi:hypothetical protein